MKRHQHSFLTNCIAGLALGVIAVFGTLAVAADTRALGTFSDWSAHQFAEKGGNVCYLYSVPKKSTGDYTKRGDTYVQVTHRVSDGTRNEVSVTAGYTYKKGSNVTIVIDGKRFSLFTDDDTAWTQDANADATLVAAMRAGATMTVQGTSSRGTLTSDTYSLSGFTAANNAIDKACGVK